MVGLSLWIPEKVLLRVGKTSESSLVLNLSAGWLLKGTEDERHSEDTQGRAQRPWVGLPHPFSRVILLGDPLPHLRAWVLLSEV